MAQLAVWKKTLPKTRRSASGKTVHSDREHPSLSLVSARLGVSRPASTSQMRGPAVLEILDLGWNTGEPEMMRAIVSSPEKVRESPGPTWAADITLPMARGFL